MRQRDLDAAAEQLRSSRAGLTRALLGADRGITEPPGPYAEHGMVGRRPRWYADYLGPVPGPVVGDADDEGAPAVPPGWEDEGR